jgi:serine/threonine protein kinase
VDWWALGVLIYEMIAGIDPFSDDDPLMVYQNILRGRLYFPKDFDNDAKILVKHLLTNDISRRYGNLKNGNFGYI